MQFVLWDRSLRTSASLKTIKFSIAFEYPEGMIGGNFQTWNLRFYNFYKQYVLFHPKNPKVEGDNAQKHVIVLENMDFDSTPKFHLFDRIVTQHSCFSNEASGRSVTDWFVPTRRFNKKEDVSKVRVDRIQGWVLPRNWKGKFRGWTRLMRVVGGKWRYKKRVETLTY